MAGAAPAHQPRQRRLDPVRHLRANVYRQLARRMGAGLEGWVLATSPMSTRGGIACRDLPADETEAVYDAVLEALKAVASDEQLPLCVNAIAQASPLAPALGRAGCDRVFYVFDHELTLAVALGEGGEGGAGGLDRSLKQFSGRRSRSFRHEMRAVDKAGYRVELCPDLAALGEEMTASYAQT